MRFRQRVTLAQAKGLRYLVEGRALGSVGGLLAHVLAHLELDPLSTRQSSAASAVRRRLPATEIPNEMMATDHNTLATPTANAAAAAASAIMAHPFSLDCGSVGGAAAGCAAELLTLSVGGPVSRCRRSRLA
jgi:hypothetical protein